MANPTGVPGAQGSQQFGIGIFVDNSPAVPNVGAPQIKLAGVPIQQTTRIQGPRVYYKALTVPPPRDPAGDVIQPTYVPAAPSSAVRQLSIISLVGGLVFVPAPPSAPAAVAAWQQPLSVSAPKRAVQLGGPSYVFRDTQFTQNSADYSTYQQPLSTAVPIPRAPLGSTFVPFNTPQFVASNWWQQLSQAVPRPPVWQGNAFVPLDTAQLVVDERSYRWWTDLSRPAPARPVWPGGEVWVGRPLAGNNVDLGGWQQPLSKSAPTPPVWQGGPVYPWQDTQFTQNTVYWGNYQQPLSRAAPRPPVWAGNAFVPFNTAQIIFNTIDYSLYQQPLSIAVPIPRAAIGNTFVPFDTVQVVAAFYGWWQGLSTAAPRPPVWQGGSAAWVGQALAGNNVNWANYQQPLSQAAPARPVWQGGAVWIGRALAGNNVTWGNYQQPLSRPADRPPVWQGISIVPLNTAQQIFNTVNSIAYLSPLSRAVPIPYTTVTVGYTFVPFDTAQVQPAPAADHHDMPFFATFGQLKSW